VKACTTVLPVEHAQVRARRIAHSFDDLLYLRFPAGLAAGLATFAATTGSPAD
jgi:hypothetical protein